MPGTEPTPTVPTLDLTPQDLTNLVDELRDDHAIYSPLFQRREQREWALTYLHGLLLDLERTSVEPMALPLHGPHEKHIRALQSFVNAGPWDDARILRQHWQEVNTTLGDDDGVLLLDGSDFPKRGGGNVVASSRRRVTRVRNSGRSAGRRNGSEWVMPRSSARAERQSDRLAQGDPASHPNPRVPGAEAMGFSSIEWMDRRA